MSTAIIEELEKYTSCDAADALAANGVDDGGVLPFTTCLSGSGITIAGPAYTVEYAPKSDPRPAVPNHYIDTVPSGAIVLIVTSQESQLLYAPFSKLTNSLYGGLMSTRAKYLGAKGTVVLGNVRDLNEHKRLNYPVHAYGLNPCAPNKLAKVVAVNQPVSVGSRTIKPGEIIMADYNGVVAIPLDKLSEALEYIPKRVAADELVAQDIGQGIPAGQAQKERRKNL